jgi:proline racemase
LFGGGDNLVGSIYPIITSVDCHCGGCPARIVVGGAPEVPGTSADDNRLSLMQNKDWFRTIMLTEPRGYPCQNLDIILPPTKNCPEVCQFAAACRTTNVPDAPAVAQAAFSYVIAENHPCYPAMSGHNTICVVTALLETGMVPQKPFPEVTEFVLESPAGPIEVRARCRDGKCEYVSFTNQPAFARERDQGVQVAVPQGDLATVPVDICYGGMWYAIIQAADIGLTVTPEDASELVRIGEMVKVATHEQHDVFHPAESVMGDRSACAFTYSWVRWDVP